MKKKEDIYEYCTAGEAAQILTAKLGRPILPNYVYKMAKRRKKPIRSVALRGILLYHKADIEASTIAQKRSA